MISQDHPFFFVLENIKSAQDITFHLSKYKYVPDSLLDEREVLAVSGREFTVDWVNAQIESLREDQELALHSRVTCNSRTFHIPMIDFSMPRGSSPDWFSRLQYYLPRRVLLNLALFMSGNSFHAYSSVLLSPKEWLEFMARLLLINRRGGDEIVDVRWVGHRLLGGYSSLRWSNNSGQYKAMPAKAALESSGMRRYRRP